MKNLLLATALLGAASFSAQAGHLQGVTISGAPLVTVTGSSTQLSLANSATVSNASGRNLQLGLRRFIVSEVAGSENNFCFGPNCYAATLNTSPSSDPLILANGTSSTAGQMELDYTPNGNAGITTIRYAVFEFGGQDSTYLTVRFNAARPAATFATQAAESILSQPFPNPATAGQTAQLRYQLPAGSAGAALILVSLADGRRVREIVVPIAATEGSIVVPTQGLAAGLYGCLLFTHADGRRQLLAARRLLLQ